MIKKINKIWMVIFLIFMSLSIGNGIAIECAKELYEIPKKAINVFVTVYKYTEDNRLTADGSIIKPGVMWCAISPNLMKKHNLSFGDSIIYNDVGYAIHDLTNDRLKNTVDILIHDDNLFSEYDTIYINKKDDNNKALYMPNL